MSTSSNALMARSPVGDALPKIVDVIDAPVYLRERDLEDLSRDFSGRLLREGEIEGGVALALVVGGDR
jgi:hypothetical protein